MGEIGDHYRDLREHRKRVKERQLKRSLKEESECESGRKVQPPPRRRCFDWMIVSGDCHYAKNRSSFKDYRRISGTAQGAKVIGIGTVELKVNKAHDSSETGNILLHNVLHIPSSLCNGIKAFGTIGNGCQFGPEGVSGYDEDGPMWYAEDFCGLWRLSLAGNPQGESVMAEMQGAHFMLSLRFLPGERENLGLV